MNRLILGLLLCAMLSSAGWADPVPVRILVDASLRGGTAYARMAYGSTGPWQRLGNLTGLPLSDTFPLEDQHPYEIRVEKVGFWTVEWGHTDFQPMWNMRDVNSEAEALLVHVRAEQPYTNLSGILLKLVLPLLVVIAYMVYNVLRRGRLREAALQMEIKRREVASVKMVRGNLTSEQRTPLPADLRIGPYRVEQKLGSGGMATVYAVGDAAGARYALKIPHREAVEDPEYLARFNREIKICVGLVHPNIVRTFDAGTYNGQDGKVTPYLVMELVTGSELVDLVRVRAKSGQPPDLGFALWVIEGVLTGLQAAHERGIIHRDIKPSNVMVTEQRQVKIMDFGIARMEHNKTVTRASGMMGTPEYMAPEQVSNPGKVDHRCDLYSCGVMMYSLVTYQLPYETQSDEVWALMMEKLTERVISPGLVNPEVPMALEGFIMKLMEIKPENRYPSAKAALNALAWVRTHPYEMLPAVTFEEPLE